MPFDAKLFWNRFPYLITTIVFAIAMAFNAIKYGVGSFLVTLLTFVFAVLIVSRVNKRRKEAVDYCNLTVTRMKGDAQLKELFHRAEIAWWVNHYFSIREDRAAFLKALTAVFPSGYREEWYAGEVPVSRSDYGREQDLRWYLYIDLPEDKDLPHHQLRFAVSDTDKKIIGALPDYTHQRVTLLESDSQQALRLYLANEAYEHLKDMEGVELLTT